MCYDQSKPLFVTSKASKDGLGFILSHDPELKEIIWTGSRVLTPAKSNYSNIECKALTLVEAVKYFHHFVAGRHFTIRTDHAPLRYIFNSSAHSERVSCRLQRWAITLKAYDYTIQYIKGEHTLLANTLSRLPLTHNVTKVPVVNMVQANTLSKFSGCDSLLQEIASYHDADISLLKRYITDSWPRHIPTKLYSKAHQEYTIQAGIVHCGCCVVPPKSLHHRIMNILHRDHPGIVHMIWLTRQYFWSSIHPSILLCRGAKWASLMPGNALVRTSSHGTRPRAFKYRLRTVTQLQ